MKGRKKTRKAKRSEPESCCQTKCDDSARKDDLLAQVKRMMKTDWELELKRRFGKN